MKKTSKPTPKKTAAKKPAAKKSSTKPKRKALAQLVERLTVIAERLGDAVDRLEHNAAATRPMPRDAALETPRNDDNLSR
jgi:hypothetical protein